MVQEEKSSCYTAPRSSCDVRDTAAKKAGYDAVRRAEAERQRQQQERAKQADKSYGSWGPVFKNRDNFNSMHFC
ncbi:hypothetical protein ONE63_003182 [Megalurothrips usitatus]|uniref:Uncharacterized protein n=1 Tax=Megalurothrips usitatus TaxID=439358 RepID=A0AAV7XCI4_9NEOP|nr:hypothetical protein ONE63_003182 [Megalurothrips usitatus]